MADKSDTRTVNMVHYPDKDESRPFSLDEYLDGLALSIGYLDGVANIGTSDDVPGLVHVYGGGTGEAGGEVRIYNDSDNDSTVQHYRIRTSGGDLYIQDSTGRTALRWFDNSTTLNLASSEGVISVGSEDTVAAQLYLRGGGATESGGRLRWYQPADDDATAAGEFFEMFADGGTLTLQRADGTDALVVNADSSLTLPQSVTMSQYANCLVATGDNGAVSPMLTGATDVSSSRTGSTAYQNTTGKPLFVCIAINPAAGRSVQISNDNFSSNIITVGFFTSVGGTSCSFWVPDNWYYRVNGALGTLIAWTEYS